MRRSRWLCRGVLAFAAWNLVRAWTGWRTLDTLSTLALSVPPWLVVASGLLWGVVGLVLGVGLCRRQPWARPAVRAAVLAHVAWTLLDRLALAAAPWQELGRRWLIGWLVIEVAVVFLLSGEAR